MFNINLHQKNGIEREIESILVKMSEIDPDSDEYTTAAKNLKVLVEAASYKKPNTISPDALLAAGVNIAGIILILNFEKIGLVTSKALNFVGKVHV